jgi:hypothetical protein
MVHRANLEQTVSKLLVGGKTVHSILRYPLSPIHVVLLDFIGSLPAKSDDNVGGAPFDKNLPIFLAIDHART